MEQCFPDEIVKLLGVNRKDKAPLLGVSASLLSQWATGTELISEHHLATLVNALPLENDAKQAELVRLTLLLWQERINRDKGRWKADSRNLASEAIARAVTMLSKQDVRPSSSGITLRDFPMSFSPLAIISGDKRESSGSRITSADIGAVSPSQAEFRWLPSLRLDRSVEVFGDKMFVLESAEQLKQRFGEKHLLVVGSPACNHLARRCLLARQDRISGWQPAAPIFRFNLPKFVLQNIESSIRSAEGKRPKELAAKLDDPLTLSNMKTWLNYLFTGGILDPTSGGHWLSGFELPPHRDYGLVSLARNPFSDPSGKPYMCIMVAGFHLFGTAHALRMLSMPDKAFQRHPFGGVLKIDIELGLRFASRFDESTAEWDDPEGYDPRQVRDGLTKMKSDLYPTLHVTSEEIDECLAFLDILLGSESERQVS